MDVEQQMWNVFDDRVHQCLVAAIVATNSVPPHGVPPVSAELAAGLLASRHLDDKDYSDVIVRASIQLAPDIAIGDEDAKKELVSYFVLVEDTRDALTGVLKNVGLIAQYADHTEIEDVQLAASWLLDSQTEAHASRWDDPVTDCAVRLAALISEGDVLAMKELVDMAAAGQVKSHIGRVGALSELGAIFDDLESGKYVGRAVVTDLGS